MSDEKKGTTRRGFLGMIAGAAVAGVAVQTGLGKPSDLVNWPKDIPGVNPYEVEVVQDAPVRNPEGLPTPSRFPMVVSVNRDGKTGRADTYRVVKCGDKFKKGQVARWSSHVRESFDENRVPIVGLGGNLMVGGDPIGWVMADAEIGDYVFVKMTGTANIVMDIRQYGRGMKGVKTKATWEKSEVARQHRELCDRIFDDDEEMT